MNFFNVLSLVISLSAIVVAILLHQNKKKQDQSIANATSNGENKKLQTETECQLKKRYAAILKQKPIKTYSGNDIGCLYLEQYFDLCSDWFSYHKEGKVSDEAWERWLCDMKNKAEENSYRAYWKSTTKRYDSDFEHFVFHKIIDPQK